MPGHADCHHCPMRDDARLDCAMLVHDHCPFRERIDPESPAYDARMPCAVLRLTLEPLGLWRVPREKKPRIKLGEKVPSLPGRR